MKQYIADANVIFSALISGKENYQKIVAEYKFYLPDFALVEIQKYQTLILDKTKLRDQELRDYTIRLFSEVTVVPNFLISNRSFLRAFQLCKSVDEKDTPYIALSIEFDLDVISKDDELVEGLKVQGYEKVISFKDFMDNL